MSILKTRCPKCSHQFAIDDVLSKEIDALVAKNSEEAVHKRDTQIYELQEQIAAKDKEIDKKVNALLKANLKKALHDQELQLKKESELVVSELNVTLAQNSEKLQLAQRNELALLRKVQEVEAKERELDLEIQRKVAEETAKAKDHLTKQIANDFHRKDVEREHLIAELRKQMVELKQKTEQGSQQAQGEIFEEEIGELLRQMFREDTIEDVPKGYTGGDIIQTVVTGNGQKVGKILWEAKRTKNFQQSWLEKLRNDRNELGAELAILVSEVLPDGKKGAYLDKGIWVVDRLVALSVAKVARQSLIETFSATMASNSRHEKADILYRYLTNPVFRQYLETIVENFHTMREDLEREKRAISKGWRVRERHLDSVVENTVKIYADIQSVVGSRVLSIQRLELPTPETPKET